MTKYQNLDLTNEQSYQLLLQDLAELQSLACDIGIERQAKPPSIFEEEHNKSTNDSDEEETLKIIKQTTNISRLAMNLIASGAIMCALYASNSSKYLRTFSSAISYIREQHGICQPPQHLLLEWEKNVMLIDLFTSDEGLYCNRRIAQDMFDICLETFDWLRSLADNHQ